ncbi:MAG TPA: GxxExxY protein [Vicinamibacterales bacterium]|nr:GxxExxY protein [Vicinamibacterales bacterium]
MSVRKSPLAEAVIGLAIEVHRLLGPGLLESAYSRCLGHELSSAGLRYETEITIPVRYKGLVLDHGYRADVIVQDELLIEIKSVEGLLPIHFAQTLTYLKMSGLRQALLFNFNERRLVDGLKSFVN